VFKGIDAGMGSMLNRAPMGGIKDGKSAEKMVEKNVESD
jgi:hypothetical protein